MEPPIGEFVYNEPPVQNLERRPMSAEDPFRIAILAMLGLVMGVGVYHRLQAAKSGERISRRDEGFWIGVPLRLAGICIWIGSLAYLINPAWMQWSKLPLPDSLRWVGAPFAAAAITLIYWTMTNLGKNLTDTVVTRTEATLVTSGPYRWVRHPFYVCVLLATVSITLLAANWFLGLCGLTVFALLVLRTPIEEQKLIDKFGDRYRTYMASTGRFWPVRGK